MLNLLIAQFSKSYEEITKTARKTITPERARILVKHQSSLWIQIFCVRQKYMHECTLAVSPFFCFFFI